MAAAFLCAALCVAASAQSPGLSTKRAHDGIALHWKENYPEERILGIDDLRSVQSSSMGRHGAMEVVEAVVRVQRAGSPPARFRVRLQYRSRPGVPWHLEHAWVDRPAP